LRTARDNSTTATGKCLALDPVCERMSPGCIPGVVKKGIGMVVRISALLGVAASAMVALGSANAEAGSANIGGMTLSCANTKVVISNQVPGPGFAVDGMIMFGPKHLRAYPPIVQRLVFLHECGHQYVGTDETAADCWAVRAAKKRGWLTTAGLRQACKALWHTAADSTHLAGPERCDALKQCFAGN
jgi:hypothetical protein